ncbi:MAG: hypothetical protein ABMB14_01085 [Myxococcota bacterium]
MAPGEELDHPERVHPEVPEIEPDPRDPGPMEVGGDAGQRPGHDHRVGGADGLPNRGFLAGDRHEVQAVLAAEDRLHPPRPELVGGEGLADRGLDAVRPRQEVQIEPVVGLGPEPAVEVGDLDPPRLGRVAHPADHAEPVEQDHAGLDRERVDVGRDAQVERSRLGGALTHVRALGGRVHMVSCYRMGNGRATLR